MYLFKEIHEIRRRVEFASSLFMFCHGRCGQKKLLYILCNKKSNCETRKEQIMKIVSPVQIELKYCF